MIQLNSYILLIFSIKIQIYNIFWLLPNEKRTIEKERGRETERDKERERKIERESVKVTEKFSDT